MFFLKPNLILCHIFVVFIPIIFNRKKALLRWVLHLHINFQLIPPRDLPCRRDRPSTLFYANNRSYLRDVHRIPTNVGTDIRLNEPFKCAEFQPDQSTHSCFMADFAKCAK